MTSHRESSDHHSSINLCHIEAGMGENFLALEGLELNIPVRSESRQDALATFWDENPNFVTAIDQLATTNTTNADGSVNYAVLGGRAGPFPEIRRIIVEAYSAVLDGGSTAQEALDEAAGRANQALSDYNAFFE